jgi:outer membrane protein assembly factor BamA
MYAISTGGADSSKHKEADPIQQKDKTEMIQFLRNNFLLTFVCLFLASCSGTSHLPRGEKLYTGAEIKLESADHVNKRMVIAVAEDAVRPLPNKSYFGMRPQLVLFNLFGEKPNNKLKRWLKKHGKAPVLMSSVKPGVTAEIIDAKLFNLGIFKAYTESRTIEKKHKVKVVYTSHLHKPYTVKELIYAISDDSISRLVLAEKNKSLIKPGADYNLDVLKNERIRIDAILKNKGYFYFNPDNLLFKADTSNVNQTVTFTITLKDSLPKNATTVYRINHVFVNQNYSLIERRARNLKDTVIIQDIVFFGKEERMAIRPKVLSKAIYLRKDEVFSRQNHIITLNRLMSMGIYKLVQVNFSENSDSVPGLLDVNILMTPLPKHTFRAGIDIVTKSNNFTGPQMSVSTLNRNTFKGAELLKLNLAGSFEAQLKSKDQNLFSYAFDPQLELTFPRFIVPFHVKKTSSVFIPRTRLLLAYSYVKRVNYFDMRTFQFMYGYKWKENIRKEHELNPIDVSYTTVGNKSAEFLALVEANPFLAKSYEEKFIAGGNYAYTYNEQVLPGKKFQKFLYVKPEITGNVFTLAKIIAGEKISAENPATIAGSAYSQYARISLDGRGYYNFRDKNRLVMRLYAGIGKPYGNSSILPYSKQFFSGGPNSLRGFQYNSVGPGTYYQNTDTYGFSQIGGDVKLEMNTEYRFNIFHYLKGAAFVDAGNVWLLKSNPSELGTPFKGSTFLGELAVGAGLGLRIDVSFFILRFDLAMPLRKPWLEESKRWVTNEIDFGSAAWRKDNLILNVAIGYPF